MAAAGLLTLAGSNNARDEIVRVGGIVALVQVLKGEGGATGFSLTGTRETVSKKIKLALYEFSFITTF